MKKLSKSMREVSRYRSLINRGVAAFESDDPIQMARVAEDIIGVKWHNPFWIGLVSLALGNILRKSGITMIRRLGWTMMGYGAADTAREGIGWATDIAEQITEIKKGWAVGEPKAEPTDVKGGIGEP